MPILPLLPSIRLASTWITAQETPPAAAPAPRGAGLSQLWLFGGVFLILYFVAIRPGMKEKKRREALLKALKKGDRVMTTSGLYGSIAQVQGEVVTLQVADGVRLRFMRQSIQSVTEEPEAEKGVEPAA